MTAIRIDKFTGMAPKLSNRLLPDTAASVAQNARMLSGELRGIREPEAIHTFSSGTIRNARRFYKDDGTPVWLGLTQADSEVVRGPLVNDSYDRYYWTDEEDYVAYNSLARIETGDAAYRLGTPAPTTAAAVAVVGGTGSTETRSYTYTFVNAFGEESKPAPVVVASGPVDGSWNLSSLPSAGTDMTNRQTLTNKRVYRTVTGLSSVSYYLVEDITLAATTYSDTTTNAVVALNTELRSFAWDMPPDTLKGIIAHPNGFLCAFDGKDLYFSEQYRPHAWPARNVLSVEYDIVGLAVYNNMVAVLTKGMPYFATGTRPENTTLVKSESAEPCLNRSSIASSLAGVIYASPNGLVLFNEAGLHVVSRPIMSIEEWSAYSPATMRGAQYGEQYIGYYSDLRGIKFAPSEPFGIFVELDKFESVDNVITDPTSGDMWLIRSNRVYKWEPPAGRPLHYLWRSKEFDFTRPVNFGAYMLKSESETLTLTSTELALYQAYNDARLPAAPLNPLNFIPLGGTRPTVSVGSSPTGIDDILQNRYPLGGSPLFNIADATLSNSTVALRVFADGRLIHENTPSSLKTYRLPTGFKAHVWQFELTGNSNVFSLAVAETAAELASV